MNYMRLIVTIFAFLVLYSVAIADQSSNIRIINRPIQLIAIDPGFGGHVLRNVIHAQDPPKTIEFLGHKFSCRSG